MKKTNLITLIAVTAAIITGCGNETLVSDSDNGSSVSTTTATAETTAAEATTETTMSDIVVTTIAATTVSEADITSATKDTTGTTTDATVTQTEHSADDPANKGGHEPTYEMEQYAVNNIDALNQVMAMFGGKGIDCDASDTITAEINGETIQYSKVSESNVFAFSNTEDVKNYMKLSLPESAYTEYMADFDRHFKDENGSLYMNTNVGRAFYQFSCDTDDMIFTDITDNSFTVTYKEADQMFGMGYVYFKNDGVNWKISGFEFK